MRKVRDWFFSIATVVAFGSVMVAGDVAQRVAYRLGDRAYEATVGWLQATLIKVYRISGVRVTTEGIDSLEPKGGYLFVSNHQSMFDIPIFGGILREHHPRYVAKRSLSRRIPTVSYYLRMGGNALIDRGDPGQAMQAIAEMGRMCEERGFAAVIFPEGTRSRDGSLGDYRVGGLAALMESAPNLAIVPTAIDGSWKVFEHNMVPIPYGTAVKVRLGTPIARTPDESPEDVIDQCRTFTLDTLAAWHRGSGDRS